MLRLLALVVVAGAAFTLGNSQAVAQDGIARGYNFGYGFEAARHFGHDFGFDRFERSRFRRFSGSIQHRIEQPPYFALYPPVYYNSQIVRRPMGVSPFAAPPGIVPVEMMHAPQAQTIVNPHYKPHSKPTIKANHESNESGPKQKGT